MECLYYFRDRIKNIVVLIINTNYILGIYETFKRFIIAFQYLQCEFKLIYKNYYLRLVILISMK